MKETSCPSYKKPTIRWYDLESKITICNVSDYEDYEDEEDEEDAGHQRFTDTLENRLFGSSSW